MLTFGSKSVADFILNWVKGVQKIPDIGPYIVAAMDNELLELCKKNDIPAFYARSADIIGDKAYLGTEPSKQQEQRIGSDRYYRTDGAAFKKMGAVKAATLQILLEDGYNVLISDADVVWFGNPWPIIGGAPGIPARQDAYYLQQADILVSTDCIDFLEDNMPGLIGHEHNTGMLFLRSTLAAIEFTKEWQMRALETTDGHDQTEFNRILKGMYTPGKPGKAFPDLMPWPYLPLSLAATPGSPGGARNTTPAADLVRIHSGQLGIRQDLVGRVWDTFAAHREQGVRDVYWLWHGQIKVGLLPMAEFLNGHLFFTRRLQEYSGIKPIAVHLTYQFGDTADYVYGKRQRLREHGLWLMEEESYFTEGNFLALTFPEEGYAHIVDKYRAIAGVCKDTDPIKSKCWHGALLTKHDIETNHISPRDPEKPIDPARPHLEVQGWLRGALRNAIVLARRLNRILVLPKLECFCERHWWLLDDCRIPAGRSEMPMPYQCPMDHIFEPAEWYRHRVDFREPAFLRNPRVPEAVKSSRLRLTLDLPKGAEPQYNEAEGVLHMADQSTYAEINIEMAKQQRVRGETRVIEIKSADVRDRLSLCAGPDPHEVNSLNNQMRDLLDGRLVEFCSKERNTLLHEVGPPLERKGKDVKEGMNCSYPGKWPVTANPVLWAGLITAENRQAWIGDLLQAC